MNSEQMEPLTRTPKGHARITGTLNKGFSIEFNGQKESGFETLAEAKLNADEIEAGKRTLQPDAQPPQWEVVEAKEVDPMAEELTEEEALEWEERRQAINEDGAPGEQGQPVAAEGHTIIDVLRWVFVLPAAIAASLLVELVNALFSASIPDLIVQWWNCWASPFVFILAGFYVAPRHKFVTALILTVLNVILICGFLTMGFTQKLRDMPLWNQIVCAAISLLAAVIACLFAQRFDQQR